MTSDLNMANLTPKARALRWRIAESELRLEKVRDSRKTLREKMSGKPSSTKVVLGLQERIEKIRKSAEARIAALQERANARAAKGLTTEKAQTLAEKDQAFADFEAEMVTKLEKLNADFAAEIAPKPAKEPKSEKADKPAPAAKPAPTPAKKK